MDRLICPNGQQQGTDPSEGTIDGAEHRGCWIVTSCPPVRYDKQSSRIDHWIGAISFADGRVLKCEVEPGNGPIPIDIA